MAEWSNFGDVNFEEYGGTLLREDDRGDIEFVWVGEMSSEGESAMYASYGVLFRSDVEDRAANDEAVRQEIENCDVKDDILEKAYVYINTYGAIQVGGGALYGHNSYPSTLEDLKVSPEQLHEGLKSVGFITEEPKVDVSLENKGELPMNVSLDTGRFETFIEIEIPPAETEEIIDGLTHMGFDKTRDLSKLEFFFCAEKDINDERDDTPFGDRILRARAPHASGNISYINEFDRILYHSDSALHSSLLNAAESAVLAYYGADKCEQAFSLENEIKTVCEIADYDLDHNTNKERYISRFCDENEDYPLTYELEVSLDKELDDVYQIEVTSTCDGEEGKGYITDINGIEELEQALYGVSNGTALVMAKEFSDKPITCRDLTSKTVQKFNAEQEKAWKEMKEMS